MSAEAMVKEEQESNTEVYRYQPIEILVAEDNKMNQLIAKKYIWQDWL